MDNIQIPGIHGTSGGGPNHHLMVAQTAPPGSGNPVRGRQVPRGTGGSALGQLLLETTATVTGDISTGLGAGEQYGRFIASSSQRSVALAGRLGIWGNLFGVASVGASAFAAKSAFKNGDTFGGALDIVDVGVGGVALYVGGLPGFVGAASYTVVRDTGLGEKIGSWIADLPNYGVSQYIGPVKPND